MPTTRRTLLTTLPLGAAALGSTQAAALPRSPGAQAEATATLLRQRWSEAETEFSRVALGLPEQSTVAPSLEAPLAALRRGAPALDIYRDIVQLPLEVQLEPPLQALLRDVLEAVGGASRASRQAIEGWLEGTETADPHIRGALGALRLGLRATRTSASRRQQLDTALGDLLDAPESGHLRAQARRHLRRLRKLEALAEKLAAAPEQSALLMSADPTLQARVEATLTARGLAPSAPLAAGHPGLIVLGMLALGVVIAFGVLVSIVGLCVIGCDGPAGIGVLLLGLGIMAVAIAGEAVLTQRFRSLRPDNPEDELPPFEDDWQGVPLQPRDLGWTSLPAEAGWVSTGQHLSPTQRYAARAWGLITGGRLWPADPDGDGVTAGRDAPLPGAPGRCLVGRVGTKTFFLGAEQPLPEGLDGPLELATNLGAAQQAVVRGGFYVQLLRWEDPA